MKLKTKKELISSYEKKRRFALQFIVIGLAGMFLPVLHATLFIAVGLLLIFPQLIQHKAIDKP